MKHPKLIEAAALHEQADTLIDEVYTEQKEAEKQLKLCYSTEVKILTEDGKECIKLIHTLKSKKDLADFIDYFGSYSRIGEWEYSVSVENFQSSVTYYRINGLLLHSGSGWLLLKTQVPCSDGEWERLKFGHIPGRLKNSKY